MSASPQPLATPQPSQPAQQPLTQGGDTVPMSFRDGSTAMVPKEKVADAMMNDGGELLHAVQFPDKSTAWVKHSDLASAFHDGGTRLDSQPQKPTNWKGAIGSMWDMLTGTGMEVGPAGAEGGGGDSITAGLTNATSGHPIKGAAQLASGVAQGVSPALGASSIPESVASAGVKEIASDVSPEAEKAAADVAKDLPQSSTWEGLKELYSVGEKQFQKAEVGADRLSHEAWQTISQEAINKASEAASAGEGMAAKGFSMAARAATTLGKWDDLWAQVGAKYPKVPVALKLVYYYELLKSAHNLGGAATDAAGITSPNKDDARDTIWGEK